MTGIVLLRGGRLMPAAASVDLSRAFAFALPAVLVGALGLDAGGYFATAWERSTIAACVVAAIALLRRGRVPLARREWWLIVAGLAWLGWTGAESLRGGAATTGIPELERGTLYLAVVWTTLVVVRRDTVTACVAGLLCGATTVILVGLGEHLAATGAAPNAVEGHLLYQPVGYANAMGILAAIAIVLALGFALHAESRVARTAAAASLAVLVPAEALTNSRGALVALCAAFLVWVVLRRPRLLLPIAPTVAVGAFAVGPHVLGDRAAYWHAAWLDTRAHPLLGSGPGSFADAWFRYRDIPASTQDAHNLYLQTLAELGPVGLVALLVFLSIPLAIAARERRTPYAAVGAAAYAAFLAHAALDWDWQLPAVTATGLVLGAATLVSAREAGSWRGAPRIAAAVSLGVALLAAAGLAGDTSLLAASKAAARSDWPRTLALAQTAASRQPWSARPLLLLGEAQGRLGDRAGAERSFRRATQLDPDDWRGWYDLELIRG